MKILWLFLAGGAGTLARYGVSHVICNPVDVKFPWGTLAVNAAGCFLAGLFWSLAETRLTISAEMRAVILIGFLGGFTTFSAFMLESGSLLRGGQFAGFCGNILLQNLIGMGALFVGHAAANIKA